MMNPFFSLRMRLMVTVLVAITPAWVLMYFTDLPWTGFLMGLLALGAAWFGGERFVLRQVRVILETTRKLSTGDLTSRTQLDKARGELGELARAVDRMAESLQARAKQSEDAEHTLLHRALQQTVVSALGQFALINIDFNALLEQAVMLVSQTLEVEFCKVLELTPDGQQLWLRAGTGWKEGLVGTATVASDRESQAGYTLNRGEPVVVDDFQRETRFKAPPLLVEHGVVSGVSVVIATRQRPYGVLGAHTARARNFTGDEVHFMLSVATALGMAVERLRTEAELHKLATFAQLNPNAALELSPDGTITYFNDAALKLALSANQEHPRAVLPANVVEIVQTSLATSQSRERLESQVAGRTLSWSFHPVAASQVVHCYVQDITDQLNLEAQLRQSQKMESIGQLAAGVAHDFNNMLTVIQGHADILMARPNLPPEHYDSAQAVYFASERAASLTRQLLMFSRKNVMQRKLLDLREVISNMTKMLKRLLGETITLEFDPPKDLPLIQGDPGMMEQVIMNLAINARDAMPGGGKLVIHVNPVEIAGDYLQIHPESRVGHFVCLRVTDNGVGMDTIIINRIFEPFFTTKEVGKGTGLGLATVYGIVKQHEGWIEVASQVGQGSTFNVFLPASNEAAQSGKTVTDPTAFVRGGTETVLVVEDEPVLRDMAHVILEEFGYCILSAGTGREALTVWEKHQGKIDLLLTDVVMPDGMSGVELAEELLACKPTLKVIFNSGYPVDEMNEAFLARINARFLQKPYTRTTLARAVRQTLDGKNPQ
ncbi:MAG: response regulator [Verrucomicrobia bacterium]|jgi:signal transduction histidine kinase/HAMP domain-containing protein|nr:response regulator [Verrucomicrobiota bacterium]